MKKYITPENTDRTLRELYGWKQIELAAYLDISRSHLAMFETGERSLPSAAMLKWLEWAKFTHVDNTLEKAKAALHLPPTPTKLLLRRAADCEWEVEALQRKLTAMQVQYEQALNNMALCPHLLSTLPDTQENSGPRHLLELTLSIATGTVGSAGPQAQALLQCKMKGLLHEAEQCRQQAAALSNEEAPGSK